MTNSRWLKPLKNHQEKPTVAANPFTRHRRDKNESQRKHKRLLFQKLMQIFILTRPCRRMEKSGLNSGGTRSISYRCRPNDGKSLTVSETVFI